MLPSLAQLTLGQAHTGEFYTLTRDEADDLNKDGGQEPLTHEPYEPWRQEGNEGATFRVRIKDKRGDGSGTYDYVVYDAENLWRWVKDSFFKTDPKTRQPLWREDWLALHGRYAPETPVPYWVAGLPSLDPNAAPVTGDLPRNPKRNRPPVRLSSAERARLNRIAAEVYRSNPRSHNGRAWLRAVRAQQMREGLPIRRLPESIPHQAMQEARDSYLASQREAP